MRGARVLLVRRAVADVAVDNDQGRAIGRVRERRQRPRQHVQIVGVADARHVPAVGDEPRRHVVAERERRRAFDGDVIVVVDPAQIAEPQVSGERRRFGRHALHHAAVAAERVHVVVEELEARPVEVRGLPAGRDRHADTRRDTLPERTRRRLDARRPAILRMAGTLAVELPKPLDVVERDRWLAEPLVLGVDRLDAGQVQHRVQQRRCVADRQNKPVAIWPDRIVWIEAQESLPQREDHRRHRHRCPGVARVGGLYGIDRKRPNSRDAKVVERAVLKAQLISSSQAVASRAAASTIIVWFFERLVCVTSQRGRSVGRAG